MSLNVQLPASDKQRTSINYGATGGENLRDLATRLSSNEAVNIRNYFVLGDGRLISRKGLETLEEVSGASPSMIKPLTSDILVYAYDDGSNSKIATYTISTDTSSVKNTFTSTDDVDGVKYGKYFFASDGTDKIGCFYADGQFLDYDAQGANFTIGETVTGGTSLATGIVVADVDAGGDGTLLLESISGTFQNNETLTGDVTGSATSDGTVYDWYELTNAPAAKKLALYNSYNGTFLFAGDILQDGTRYDYKIMWSQGDTDETTIPFSQSWAAGSPPDPDDGGVVLYRGGGSCNKILSHENKVYAFYDDATTVFHLENINVDTSGLSQTTVVDQQGNNFGGYSAIATPKGVFYTNENGVNVFNLASPTDVEIQITNILGDELIADIDFADSEILWDGETKIFIFCAKNGSTNNYVLVYDFEKGVWTEITGWTIRRAVRLSLGNKNKLFGVSSVNGKLYQLLSSFSDDGLTIDGRILFRQEAGNDPVLYKTMKDFWGQGKLSPSNLIKIDLHKWDRKNTAIEAARTYWWAGGSEALEVFGIGKTPIGKGIHPADTIIGENFFHVGRSPLTKFLKYQIELTTSYEAEHEIHFLETSILPLRRVKLNNLSTSKPS